MARQRKSMQQTWYQKVGSAAKGLLCGGFLSKVILLTFMAVITLSALEMVAMADIALQQWQQAQVMQVLQAKDLKIQGALQNVAPMVEFCMASGGAWVWDIVDSAEIRGICARPSAPPPQRPETVPQRLDCKPQHL